MKEASYGESAFNCPRCSVYAKQEWYALDFRTVQAQFGLARHNVFEKKEVSAADLHITGGFGITYSECAACEEMSIWSDEELVYPRKSNIEKPKELMPEEVKKLYEEARDVFPMSPRSSSALLRLALEILLPHIGAEKGSINDMIGQLARERRAIERVLKAMDVVRVTGNNAVHPGVLDVSEENSREISISLFKILNYIVAETLETDAMINEVYQTLPKAIQENIEKRNVPRV